MLKKTRKILFKGKNRAKFYSEVKPRKILFEEEIRAKFYPKVKPRKILLLKDKTRKNLSYLDREYFLY